MYLISAYFDEKTNRIINRYINQIAAKTGNPFMTEMYRHILRYPLWKPEVVKYCFPM